MGGTLSPEYSNSYATFTGGGGIDTFKVTGTDTITDLGNGGADIVQVTAGGTVNATVTQSWTATTATSNNGTASINANGYNVSLALARGTNGWTITNNSATGVTLIGSSHNDIIIGGSGNDTLKGGGGGDRFVFNTTPNNSTNHDTILDFVHGADILQLSKSVFNTISNWNSNAFWSGAGVTAAHDSSDRIVYNTTTGNLYYDADGIGGISAPVLVATIGISTHPAVTYGDIQLVA